MAESNGKALLETSEDDRSSSGDSAGTSNKDEKSSVRPAPPMQVFEIPAWSGTDGARDDFPASFTGPPPEVPGNPWRKQTGWNVSGCLIYGLFLCAYFFYFYVRIRYTLGGGILWYSLFVLVFEVLASSSMVIHGLALLRVRKHVPPPADLQPPEQDYNIRVVIPCYTESVDIVRLTVLAAANALLPGKCKRTVYLLDDGKDPAKCAWVAKQKRSDIVYISGRVRQKGESNGKACNLNNTLTKLFPPGKRVDDRELLTVFDADMVCVPEFFVRVLAELLDPQVALVLTPQKFHNYDMSCDIFNHSNLIYWQISLPGLDGWDNVSCTGTNFVVRARAAAEAGWFPTYTLGEDMALALEIQKAGWKGAYVKEYLAVGEVPETVRNAFMQKSRWCKGGMQIFLSHHNAIFARNMSIMQKLLWNTSGWAYICTTLTTPVFLIIPIIGVWMGYFPLEFTWWFALAFSIYFPATWMLLYYCHHISHMRSIYFSIIAGNMFWFAYAKATFNTLVSTVLKRKIKFKTTEKSVMAATVTDEANKAKNVGNSHLSHMWTNVQDVWIHFVIFLLCMATALVGFVRLMNEVDVHTVQTLSILVSMGWAAYNMTAPYLLLHYCFFKSRGLRVMTIVTAFTSTAIVATIVVLIWIVLPNEYDYAQVLRLSYRFYTAQRSGELPADNPIAWRGNSGLTDRAPDGSSLVGGFYDDGGVIKASFPLAFTTTLLAWGMLAFPQGYHTAGLTTTALDTLKWSTDYMLKCSLKDGNGNLAYVAQVGSYATSRQWWGRPEQMPGNRPVFLVDSTHHGSDLLAGTAAALAASSMVFQQSSGPYADTLYNHAEMLYQVATTHLGVYSDSVPDAAYQYPSSGYLDDLAWGAAWLYAARQNPAYLAEAASYFSRAVANRTAATPMVFNWDNVLPGTAMLMSNLTKTGALYKIEADTFLNSWMHAKNGVVRTMSYASWLGPTGTLRNTANAAFLAWVDARQGHATGKQTCWAEFNMRLILGDQVRSFVVGYGAHSPRRPQHGAASCSGPLQSPCNVTALWSSGPNPHVLEGALVSGPIRPDDQFKDVRTLVSSRVALDYNAAFSGVLAALVEQRQATFTHCTQGHGFFYNHATRSPI